VRQARCRSRGLRRGPFVVALSVGMLYGKALAAQFDSSMSYHVGSLACVSLHQSVMSELETVHGKDRRTETIGWEGEIVLKADADTGGTVSLIAWFERLRVWRDVPEGRLEPATDGILGGRYRGVLGPAGDYRRISAPFVPDAVSAIAAMDTALDELFPPLPTTPLAPGGTTADGRGWGFDRLSDTVMASGTAWRLRLLRNDTTSVSVDWGDGQFSEGESVEEERSRMLWQPGMGPLSWNRRITTVVIFPTTIVSDRAVRTEVRQERRFSHLGVLPPERCRVP
jgi:hypothetical protein